MNVFLRSLTACVMALMLALTSQTLAVAQGQAAAVGELEICHGFGVVSIPVDAEGNPTGPPIVCPDFAAALALEGQDGPSLAALNPVWNTADFVPGTYRNSGRAPRLASARDPPVWG
ncbi:hypothetical protein TRP8649_03537 [Pelagimonas phthalicica]|uniref:Uncharacterized protein n=1 Tax=Pelagimonas phthalicica TaxID=1037362 RepID=A0A238JG81_9RHOB|nr:hypothetical protein [Pelagimonas phthalicica]TDS92342.1 hypothetical protein CLV87_3534 [Pelagimonas phthalicica]SMX29403.1 hypothetical protein TRP8649_03537 [Pelagimonas phthalicica]